MRLEHPLFQELALAYVALVLAIFVAVVFLVLVHAHHVALGEQFAANVALAAGKAAAFVNGTLVYAQPPLF